MKILLLLLLLLPFVSCNEITTAKTDGDKVNNNWPYPKIIDSLNLFKEYDSSKLAVYLWSSNHPFEPISDSSVNKTFGELDLVFDTVLFKNDTTEFYFNFIFKGKEIYSFSLRHFQSIHNGVAINKLGKRLYAKSPSGFTAIYKENYPYNEIEYPFQPSVVKYLQDYKTKLNPWLREEAIRRGVIK
jgi:hypothetical protein